MNIALADGTYSIAFDLLHSITADVINSIRNNFQTSIYSVHALFQSSIPFIS